jgi:hypothetical protein
MLRAVAAHLNAHGVHGEPSRDEADPSGLGGGLRESGPRAPATSAAPLTVPSHLMAAQYPAGGVYRAHSDNGLEWVEVPTDAGPRRVARRHNARQFTAIVYANRPTWVEADGGALKVYLGSDGGATSAFGAALLTAETAERLARIDIETASWPADRCVEVVPVGGRLVIFNSKLFHEVHSLSATI